MIKWPWKEQETARNDDWPWDDALAIPLLVNLTEQEQARLIALAERFLQQKRLVALQGFELDALKSARIALLFCLPVLELGMRWSGIRFRCGRQTRTSGRTRAYSSS